MSARTGIYALGIPLAVLWLLIEITDIQVVLLGIVFIGFMLFVGMVLSVAHGSTADPYKQYVRQHNEMAMILRAEEAERLQRAAELEAQGIADYEHSQEVED